MQTQKSLFTVMSILLATSVMTAAEATPAMLDSIPGSAQEVKPILIGAPVPDVLLETAAGSKFSLKKHLTKKPTVLIFYRGGWCPFCTRHLASLQEAETSLLDLGYQILAVSPDRPTKLAESQDKIKPSYTLLSDRHMQAAAAFGIAYRVDDPTLKKLERYKIDIEDASGETHHLLPVPSVFIVGKDGRIGFTYVNPDYKVRLDSEVLLAAGKAVQKQ